MRVAVLVYGRLNNCLEHYDNIKEHLGKENDIDFFLSSCGSDESLLYRFLALFNPVLYNNDTIDYTHDFSKYPGYTGGNVYNMTRHYMNKNRVFSLLEEHIQKENIKYDVVVSIRMDVLFESSFDFSEILDNTIYIPYINDYTGCYGINIDGINDQIAYGNVDVMKKYNSINAIELLERRLCIPHPEPLTLANIRFHGLHIKRVDVKYEFHKCRINMSDPKE